MSSASSDQPVNRVLWPSLILWFVSCAFGVVVVATSWFRWATFQYRTFDIAFYVQAFWLLLRGQWHTTLLNVPLMGNHAEPVIFLLVPVFALWPHPMVLVICQAVALATMPFTAWRICGRLGFDRPSAVALALTLLLIPATGFVALHEFHPEAFSAPLLLFMLEARLAGKRGWYWVWFLAVLGCKENMALLLIAYCIVTFVTDRKRGWQWLGVWCLLPMTVAGLWLVIYGKILGPAWNAGNVEFAALYSHLGKNGVEIVKGFFFTPERVIGALTKSVSTGNLIWGLLLPFLFLPLFRPKWLVIAAPVLFQHLLSWRQSEWMIYFHYAAPLIPLFWIAAVEAVQRMRFRRLLVFGIVGASLAANLWFGPVRQIVAEISTVRQACWQAAWKNEMLGKIPPEASVTAGLPYLSHLAKREKLFSLHHVLKGLKTLSHERYLPPEPTEFVVIDYDDSATLDPRAGYYHPRMRTISGEVIPSSSKMLHDFLQPESRKTAVTWIYDNCNGLSILHRIEGPIRSVATVTTSPLVFDQTTRLDSLLRSGRIIRSHRDGQAHDSWRIKMKWNFSGERRVFPWMSLLLESGSERHVITKGICAPGGGWADEEEWSALATPDIAPGKYHARAFFSDHENAVWSARMPPTDPGFVPQTINLGEVEVIQD